MECPKKYAIICSRTSRGGARSSHNCADINFVVALNLTLHLPGRTVTCIMPGYIMPYMYVCMCSLSVCLSVYVCVRVCLCSYLTRTRNTIKQHLNARLVFVQLDTTRHVACARNNWYFNGPTELSGCRVVGGYRWEAPYVLAEASPFSCLPRQWQEESAWLTFNVDVCILTLIAFIVSTRGCKKR